MHCPKCCDVYKIYNMSGFMPSRCELDEAIEVMARAVIAGGYGNGKERKERLYTDIQGRVNEICGYYGWRI